MMNRVQPHGNQPKTVQPESKPTSQNVLSRGICERLSDWLWPTQWGHPCETPTPSCSTRQPYADCKACREWHVDCDHARPQCSHCTQEQLLCFYVDPTANPKMRKRKPKPKVPVPTLRPIVPPTKGSPGPERTLTLSIHDQSRST